MKRPLALAAILVTAALITGGILLARTVLWFGPDLDERDYAADVRTHLLEANGVSPEEAEASWAAYQAVIDAVIAADEAVSGEPAWQPDGSLRLRTAIIDTPEHRAEARPFFDALRKHGAPARLDELAAAPPPVRPQSSGGDPLPVHADTKAVRSLVRALAIELHESIVGGETDAAARALRHTIALARALEGQATLLEHLLGIAVRAKGMDTVRHALLAAHEEGAAVPAEMIDALRQALGAGGGPGIIEALEGERRTSIATIAAELPPAGRQLRAISRGAQASRIDTVFDEAIAFASRPAPDRFGETYEPPELGRMDVIASILLPSLDKFIVSGDQIAMQRHATVLMLHIERHIAATGVAPAAIEDLGLPPESLRDPWSGKPYGYRTLSSDAHNRPYLLWAVGANGVDEGGAEHPDGNDRALSDREAAADWIVNAPRAEQEGSGG